MVGMKMKTVKAVQPYIYEGQINFKHKPYDAWEALGLPVAESCYPWRWLHGFVFRYAFPRLWRSKREARLRFVQPWSLSFDTWPDYIFYEIIPFFWDVWPENFKKTCEWLSRYDVKTAVFTSSQVVEMIRERFPEMNVIWCPEGIDVDSYKEGETLSQRTIDFLHYGREIDDIVCYDFSDLTYVSGKQSGKAVLTQEQLYDLLSDAKVVATYPKSWTNPELAGNIETLTQRYWECMLSRCIMIGHAPKELVELIGYNPVIELDKEKPQQQLEDVLAHIVDYQGLVDKNRGVALKYGDWKNIVRNVFVSKKNINVCLSK